MDEAGHHTLEDVRGRALPTVVKWEDLDLNYHLVAEIDQAKCIGCRLCYTACEDGAHQAIRKTGDRDPVSGARVPNSGHRASGPGHPPHVVEIVEEACVGCNLCSEVCPVHGCITMRRVPNDYGSVNWKEYASGRGKLAPRSTHFHTATWGRPS
jgi:dihydropyrimidine dehydrogenase (NAD+) subunit PreA